MIKIFSIKEIVEASTSILNSPIPNKLNTKKTIKKNEIKIPNDNIKLISEKMPFKKTLVLNKKTEKSDEAPPNVETIIVKAEENQFKILSEKSKKIKNIDNQKIINELYELFNKKIKKNTLKLIVDLRNNINSLDQKILSLKEKEQKNLEHNKLLKQDIKDLNDNKNKLKNVVQKKDLDLDISKKELSKNNKQIIKLKNINKQIDFQLKSSQDQNNRLIDINNELREDINQLKTKIDYDENKLKKFEKDINDLNLKLKGYKNQNIKLEKNNKILKKDNFELKSTIDKIQERLEYFEKNNQKLSIKLEKNINQKNDYKKRNNELDLKLNELDELKQYRYKYFEYKQKNSDLENILANLKVDEDKNLQNLDIIKKLEKKIKFYQDENIRIGTELSETKKKSKILKDEIEKYENQRSGLIKQINSVNEVIKDSNILTNVFENKIKPKVDIIDPQNIQKKPEFNLNDKVKAIFSKKNN